MEIYHYVCQHPLRQNKIRDIKNGLDKFKNLPPKGYERLALIKVLNSKWAEI